jgi:hypothetical protein
MPRDLTHQASAQGLGQQRKDKEGQPESQAEDKEEQDLFDESRNAQRQRKDANHKWSCARDDHWTEQESIKEGSGMGC